MHSSKRLLVETLNSSYHLLGDAIINLTLAKGELCPLSQFRKI